METFEYELPEDFEDEEIDSEGEDVVGKGDEYVTMADLLDTDSEEERESKEGHSREEDEDEDEDVDLEKVLLSCHPIVIACGRVGVMMLMCSVCSMPNCCPPPWGPLEAKELDPARA